MRRSGSTLPGALAPRLASVLLLLAASTFAASAQDLFPGKSVRMIVPSVPGGVTDVGARAVGRFIAKYLPQSPNIVVVNIAAANGIAATNHFYREVPADGLTFLAGSSSQGTPDIFRKNPVVRYDPAKFAYIGGVQNAGTMLIIAKRAIERLTGRAGEPVVMAQVGGTRAGALMSLWGSEYLGWRVRWVTGYQGTPQTVFALLRGEAAMMATAGIKAMEPLLKTGNFVPIAQPGLYVDGKLRRRDAFPDVPLASELLHGKIDGLARRAFDGWLRTVQVGKYYALPPGT